MLPNRVDTYGVRRPPFEVNEKYSLFLFFSFLLLLIKTKSARQPGKGMVAPHNLLLLKGMQCRQRYFRFMGVWLAHISTLAKVKVVCRHQYTKSIAHVQLRAEIELIITMHFLIFLNEEYKSNSSTLCTKAAVISCYPCCCCGCRYDETSLHFL